MVTQAQIRMRTPRLAWDDVIAANAPGIAVFLILSFAPHAEAQARIQIHDCRPSCSQVEFRTVARVGGHHGDSVLLMLPSVPIRLGGGGYVAGRTAEPGVVAVYDSLGGFRRTLGHAGGGPGEFRQPQAFFGPLGQTWVVDPGNARITVLDANGHPINDFRYNGRVFYTAPLDSSRVVVSGPMESGGTYSPYAFHIMDSRGRVLRSFAPWPANRQNRRVAVTPWGTVVATYEDRYVVEEWSIQGELLRTLTRDVSWFPPGSRPGFREPGLANTAVDETGRLWIVLIRPKPGLQPIRRNRPVRGLETLTENADAVVEVIDMSTAEVVARGERDNPYLFPLFPFTQEYRTPAQDSLGYYSFLIIRAAVSGPPE
ncbi:MAG: hypothetical protein R6U63_16215 [Longimicrobiales bacterium]